MMPKGEKYKVLMISNIGGAYLNLKCEEKYKMIIIVVMLVGLIFWYIKLDSINDILLLLVFRALTIILLL